MPTYFWIVIKTNKQTVELGPYIEYPHARLLIAEHWGLVSEWIGRETIEELYVDERIFEECWITIQTKLEVKFDNNELEWAIG